MKKFFYVVMGSILTALGFSSCSSASDEEPQTLEYGVIVTNFIADIKVTDESGTPIKGIRAIDLTDYGDAVFPAIRDTIFSDENGIVSGAKLIPNPIEKYVLAFKDVDGDKNGGTFAPDTAEFDVKTDDSISAWLSYKAAGTEILKKEE